MTLSDFIKNNLEAIIEDWQEFARTLTPAAQSLDRKALRDFAEPMLKRIAEDMAELQSREEQAEKSRGEQNEGAPDSEGVADLSSAARTHARERLTESFTQDQLLAEFRALRAYVTRR